MPGQYQPLRQIPDPRTRTSRISARTRSPGLRKRLWSAPAPQAHPQSIRWQEPSLLLEAQVSRARLARGLGSRGFSCVNRSSWILQWQPNNYHVVTVYDQHDLLLR